MTYSEAIQFLYGLRWFGAKFGLENTRQLAALAGHPERRLRFIHVAGTNGKGSTCAMLESIYRAAGRRVGLYTSPHLVSFRERIQVNRQLIGEGDVVRLVDEMRPWLGEFPAEHRPTFFEFVTVLALRYFAESDCEVVIWETGLGGRLDATNIVTPLASVITNIGLDHQQWLGPTLAHIAAEKAGIIKPGLPALSGARAPAAREVIARVAREQGTHLIEVDGAQEGGELPPLALPGSYQQSNAALAVATVTALQAKLPVSAEAIRQGLATVHWPGRLQLSVRPDGQRILLDGAHNAEGAAVLRAALDHAAVAAPAPRTLILGILNDKDWRRMCEILAPLAARLFVVPVNTERSALPQDLLPICQAAHPAAATRMSGSLAEALREAHSDPVVVIAGSLYLIGEAMELLGLSPVPAADEKALNNWQPAGNRMPRA